MTVLRNRGVNEILVVVADQTSLSSLSLCSNSVAVLSFRSRCIMSIKFFPPLGNWRSIVEFIYSTSISHHERRRNLPSSQPPWTPQAVRPCDWTQERTSTSFILSENSPKGYQLVIKHRCRWLEINEADSSCSVRYQLKYVTLISSQLRQCLITFDIFLEIFPTIRSNGKAGSNPTKKHSRMYLPVYPHLFCLLLLYAQQWRVIH